MWGRDSGETPLDFFSIDAASLTRSRAAVTYLLVVMLTASLSSVATGASLSRCQIEEIWVSQKDPNMASVCSLLTFFFHTKNFVFYSEFIRSPTFRTKSV